MIRITTKRKLTIWLVALSLLALLALFACAPKQASENQEGESASEATVETAWSEKANCMICHTAEAASAGDADSIYSLHAPQGLTCTICHTNTDGELADAHKEYTTAKLPTKLTKTSVTGEVCTSCHNIEELKAATAALTVLTDSKGTTVNPHDLPTTEGHLESVTCANCHKMHLAESVEEQAPKVCISCHHQGVYECGTCH